MNRDVCFQLGYVIKKHGHQGAVNVHLDVDYPDQYLSMESVFIEINDKLVPFFIESIQIRGQQATIKFEDINDQEEAQSLKSHALYLPLSVLPPLENGQFYYHDIIGYQVEDKKFGLIGFITEIVTTAKQDLMLVDHNGKEVIIPVHDNTVIEANHKIQIVHVILPEGLLEVYLDS